MLPTFLGIGAPRAGTTWLHSVLESHPEVAVPTSRKELHYFDLHYDRGVEWYGSFFPPDSARERYSAVGEITPHYLFDPVCPGRITEMGSVEKLVAILRNPVDRAFSHYLWRMRQDRFQGSFDSFIVEYPKAILWGRYSEGVRRYLEHFSREQMLILIHEEVFPDTEATLDRIACFLEIERQGFAPERAAERVNPALLPRHDGAYGLANRVKRWMRRRGLDRLPGVASARAILKRAIVGKGRPAPVLTEEARRRLADTFHDDIREMEQILHRDLSLWTS